MPSPRVLMGELASLQMTLAPAFTERSYRNLPGWIRRLANKRDVSKRGGRNICRTLQMRVPFCLFVLVLMS